MHALCFAKRITQLIERDVRIMRHKLFDECCVSCKFALADRFSLGGSMCMTFGTNAKSPSCACGSGNL